MLVLSHSMDADPASHLAIRCAKKFRQPRCLDLRLHFNRVDRVVKKPLPTAIILEAKSTNNHKWCTSQCRHLMPDGSRCGTMSMVENDDIVPVARGGGSEASNVTLLCREHNQYRARLVMGDRTMDQYRSSSRHSGSNTSFQ